MDRHSKINNVATLGLCGNFFLLCIKLYIGLITRSQAMIADGLNSAGDVFASVMTFIGNRISSKPGDTDHPYGHGKAEYIFSMIISFSLLLVAFSIFRSSLNSLTNRETFTYSPWLVVVALTTIIVKLLLYFYCHHIGLKYKSLLAIANSADHRNDVFISLLTLLSIISGYYNISVIDGIAGMIISFWIAYTGIQIFYSAYSVLMDTNISNELMQEMSLMLDNIKGIDHIDAIISKPVGLNFLLIVKVSIDANLSIYEGHKISDDIKDTLLTLDHIEDVVVHLNPAQFHPPEIHTE